MLTGQFLLLILLQLLSTSTSLFSLISKRKHSVIIVGSTSAGDLCALLYMVLLHSQDSVVEIAFIPGKGSFASSSSLHNGVQRAAGSSSGAARYKLHHRSPEVRSPCVCWWRVLLKDVCYCRSVHSHYCTNVDVFVI